MKIRSVVLESFMRTHRRNEFDRHSDGLQTRQKYTVFFLAEAQYLSDYFLQHINSYVSADNRIRSLVINSV
jgi:hypothetical protein